MESHTASTDNMYERKISELLNDVAASAAENEKLRSEKDDTFKKQEEKIADLEQRLATQDVIVNRCEEDVERLKAIAHQDGDTVTALQFEIENLKETNAKLSKENAELVGHHNYKQKIQYHVQLKEQNTALLHENARLKGELAVKLPKTPTSLLKEHHFNNIVSKKNHLKTPNKLDL
ncbi:hyaluronan mediated motility receptor-like [Gigantopelta aegis]|uniref:hyaluronan mediated motility receptor-like n=1 Tax=Gigantopelta aegis TaxID=1735272 RepID=UPI001B888E1C|nr:hyaluronan mediated motility receptor-like [Gigantopelta aegis]